ncbi:MAG: class I SAM-dependent methyltransferase [Pseudomonadota bacterium]
MELTAHPSSHPGDHIFWDRIADRYARQPIADQAAYQRKLDVSREYFRSDMNVLEFGCGTGGTALLHAPYVKHIRASDISPQMIAIAEAKRSEAKTENVSFEVGTIESLSAPDGTLDAVLGLSILHLLEDKEAAIARVYRMLKPDGVFISSTACLGDTMKFFKVIAPIGRVMGLMPMVKVFTSEHLKTALKRAGFKVEYTWQPRKGKAIFMVARK